jgi:hypothetical protein
MNAAKRVHIAAISLTITLGGCAAKLPPPPTVDFATMQCSPAPILANATPLSFDPKNDKLIPVLLDSKADCLVDANGSHALYRVFSLPDTDQPYILRVIAAPWGNTILAPRALLLDGAGSAKRTTTHADFTFRGNSLAAFLRSHSDEKYVVVSSDPEILGNSVTRINESTSQQMLAAGPVFFSVYTGSDTATNLTLSPAGNASVTISPLPAK